MSCNDPRREVEVCRAMIHDGKLPDLIPGCKMFPDKTLYTLRSEISI